MKHYKIAYQVLKHYLSKLSWEREIFIVEVPTTMESEQQKQQLMADVLEILEHQVKIH
jgi:hypothetical protein